MDEFDDQIRKALTSSVFRPGKAVDNDINRAQAAIEHMTKVHRVVALIKANLDEALRSTDEYIHSLARAYAPKASGMLEKQIDEIFGKPNVPRSNWAGNARTGYTVNSDLDHLKAMQEAAKLIQANPVVALTSEDAYIRKLAKHFVKITPEVRKALKEKLPKKNKSGRHC